MTRKKKKNIVDLTQGNVFKILMSLALPLIGSSLLQFTYNLMDMFFVGKLGSGAIASIGTASFISGLGYAMQAFVVIGTGIKVSHALGKKEHAQVEQYIATGLRINLYMGVFYTVLVILLGRKMIDFFNLKDTIIVKDAILYLMISGPMVFFSFYNLLYTRILGSFGDNYTALKVNSVGIILNIILDPILIYNFKLGVMGAAVASLIGNFIVFILFYYKTKNHFKVNWMGSITKSCAKEIIKLGLPMTNQRILFTIVNILLARQVAVFGAPAIAAQKIGFQIESVSLMVLGGLNGATASFIGQNYGAGKFKRINEGYRKAVLIGIVYTLPITAIFLGIPEILTGFFVADQQTILVASNYLRYIGITLAFAGVEMISNGTFSGLGLPKIPARISIIFTLLRLPFALYFTKFMGVDGIWFTIALTSSLKGIIAFLIYNFKVRKEYEYA
ncbi:MAG: MATE family efflux transporter [Cellulosilyticaceae bacterium]